VEKEIQMRFNDVAQSPEDDNYNKWDVDDTRRPKLTLKHLHKLRNMKELAKKEHAERVKDFKNIYGSASDGAE
jgi:hypothetical protein